MSDALAEFKEGWPFVVRHPVQWGDMDALGHVNNVIYFRYFETARVAYLNALNLDLNGAVGALVADSHARYRLPLYYPDTIRLGVRVRELHTHGCLQEYAIFSNEQNKLTTTGSARIVLLNKESGQKEPWPTAWKQAIDAQEGRSLTPASDI